MREEFPHDRVFLSEGYKGRVHVKIVSPRFNGMRSAERQVYIYGLLRAKVDADSDSVSLVSAYSVDQL